MIFVKINMLLDCWKVTYKVIDSYCWLIKNACFACSHKYIQEIFYIFLQTSESLVFNVQSVLGVVWMCVSVLMRGSGAQNCVHALPWQWQNGQWVAEIPPCKGECVDITLIQLAVWHFAQFSSLREPSWHGYGLSSIACLSTVYMPSGRVGDREAAHSANSNVCYSI